MTNPSGKCKHEWKFYGMSDYFCVKCGRKRDEPSGRTGELMSGEDIGNFINQWTWDNKDKDGNFGLSHKKGMELGKDIYKSIASVANPLREYPLRRTNCRTLEARVKELEEALKEIMVAEVYGVGRYPKDIAKQALERREND